MSEKTKQAPECLVYTFDASGDSDQQAVLLPGADILHLRDPKIKRVDAGDLLRK